MDKASGLVLRFQEPTGLVGHHAFHVIPDGRAGTVLRHELVARAKGRMRVVWPLAMRWMHDAVLEELLDRAEVSTGTAPAQPYERSRWVRTLRASRRPRPRAVPVRRGVLGRRRATPGGLVGRVPDTAPSGHPEGPRGVEPAGVRHGHRGQSSAPSADRAG